ncbi:MAG TPA: hypothetical protein VGF82_00365 [Terracidiphilus sp.]
MRGDTGQFRELNPAGSRFGWMRVCLVLMCAATVTCIAQDGRPAPTPNATAAAQSTQNPTADAKAQKGSGQAATAGDSNRKKQIADESTQLLSMALALKAEVDKTTKDTLSLNVIRKADEIEKLAHTVKEKMKLSAGAS